MTAPTTYHLRDASGTEVFTGTITPPPGGGSQPVTDNVSQTGAGAKLGTVISAVGRSKMTLAALIDDIGESGGLWVLTRPSNGLWLPAPAFTSPIALAAATANDFTVTLPAGTNVPQWGANIDGNGFPAQSWLFLALYDEVVVLMYVNGSGGEGSSDLLTAFVDPDADLDFSHDLSGTGKFQSLWSVEFVDPGLPDQPLSFDSPDGFLLRFTLATDSMGAITTTANDIAAISDNGISLWCSISATGTGDGVVEAFGPTNWPDDGDDGTSTATITAAAVVS